MAKPKVGDTKNWNARTGTGYKWNGKGWVPYRNHKPVRTNRKGEGRPTGIDIPNQLAKPFRLVHSGIKGVNQKAKKAKERREKEGVGEYKDPKEKEKLKVKNEAVTAEKKPATTPKKPEATTPKKSESLKTKKMGSIEKRNREIHGDAAIDALKKKHAEFKAKRKAGTHRKRKLTRAEELKKRTGR